MYARDVAKECRRGCTCARPSEVAKEYACSGPAGVTSSGRDWRRRRLCESSARRDPRRGRASDPSPDESSRVPEANECSASHVVTRAAARPSWRA